MSKSLFFGRQSAGEKPRGNFFCSTLWGKGTTRKLQQVPIPGEGGLLPGGRKSSPRSFQDRFEFFPFFEQIFAVFLLNPIMTTCTSNMFQEVLKACLRGSPLASAWFQDPATFRGFSVCFGGSPQHLGEVFLTVFPSSTAECLRGSLTMFWVLRWTTRHVSLGAHS